MIREYIDYMGANKGSSPLTLKVYARELHVFVDRMRKTKASPTWSNVTQADVETWVADMTRQGLTASTIRRRVSIVRSCLRWAQHRGYIANNPARFVSTPKQATRVPRTMPYEDIRATIADDTIDSETRTIIALMAETGIRIGEALAIKTTDINKQQRSIVVTGKGNKQRVVVYGKKTAQLLSAYYAKSTGVLFTLRAERDARWAIYTALRKHTQAKKCSSHVIRHSFACEHISNGTDIKTLATMMGHTDVHTTEIYAQVAGAQLLRAFNNITI